MKKLILLALSAFSFQSHSATLVSLDEAQKTLTLTSHIVFYNRGATPQVAEFCTNEIRNVWSALAQNQYVQLGQKNYVAEGDYKIIFNISSEIMDAKKVKALIKKADQGKGQIFENVYIEVPKRTDTKMLDYGGNVFDGSTGSISDQAIMLPFKNCAHEFGHILGLGEMNNTDTPPTLMTQGGIRTPYEAYQVKVYDPRFFNMDVGTFDMKYRQISKREIDEVKRQIQFLYFKQSRAVLNCPACTLD